LLLVLLQDLKVVLDWLSHQPAVYWLYPKPQMRLHNINAGAITQGAVFGKSFDSSRPETHPFWSKGLDGKGQLIGVGDSGIDVDSCYFFDPEVPFSSVGASPSGRRMFSSKSHRKIASYNPIADPEMLDRVGHGTHVVGSIIGEKLGSRSDAATGVAPGARVAFLDLSRQADGSDVNTPENLMDNYFMLSYNMGVRVHSGEPGAGGGGYRIGGGGQLEEGGGGGRGM
jgi:subtilisin family serine protease